MRPSIVAITLLSLTSSAGAFEIYSPISESCHEDLVMSGARLAGFPELAAAPAATEDQRRAMDDLVFELPNADPWTLALLIGVRSNDVARTRPRTRRPVHLHDNPDDQPRTASAGRRMTGRGETSARSPRVASS